MSHFALVRTEPPHVLLSNQLHIKVVELSKLSGKNLANLDIVGKWCYFIRKSGGLSSKELESLSKEPELKMAVKHFKSLSEDQELILRIREENGRQARKNALRFSKNQAREKGMKEGRKEGREEGRKEGRKEGREEGREEEKRTLVVNLLKKKQPISFISEVTAWSEEKVLKLIKDIGLKE